MLFHILQVMEFKCYYCVEKFHILYDIKTHIEAHHPGEPVKFRQLTLNETTGQLCFVTKQFRRTFTSNVHHCKTEEKERQEEERREEEELLELTKRALSRLKEEGLLSDWVKLHRVIADGTLPMNNISLLLFIDVVRFYSCKTSTQMRYRDETKKFWQAAYRIFHGKILRFMGGPKHRGQDAEATENLDPKTAKINFAIPGLDSLQPDEKGELDPGILHSCIQTLASTTKSRMVKVSFDAKKINSALTPDHGDVNLFGHEQKPSLGEKRQRRENSIACNPVDLITKGAPLIRSLKSQGNFVQI